MNKLELTYQTYSLLSVPKIHTDLLWDLSILFGGLGLLYFGIIFYFRNKSLKRKRSDLERRKNLAPSISNFLFFEEESSREEQNEYIDLKVQIREFIKDPQNKRVLREILLDLQKDLTGDSRKKLFKLYLDYDLHLDAYKKLKSWRWQVISKGIQELTQMQVVEAYSFIKKFINDPRSVIRKQAQIATVSLKHEGISHFLDTNKYHISEWQQIKILEVLQNLEDFIPPKFGAWLTSNNKDVVLFSLRLIKVYNQIDANVAITELVKHQDNEIKIAAIHCIKEFGITDSLPTLKASFHKCSAETKIALVGAIGHLGDHSVLEYLETIYKKESNFNVQSKIISAINEIAPESILPTLDLDPSIHVLEEAENTVTPETMEEQTVTDLIEENSSDLSEIVPVAIPEEIDEHSTEPTEIPAATEPEEEIEESVSMDEEMPAEIAPQEEDEAVENQSLEEDYRFSGLHLEDLDIFEICFMEELNDLLSEEPSTDDSAMYNEYLPLDFLPIVAQQTTTAMSKNKNQPVSNQVTRNLEVIFEHIHPDENFRKELENILSRIEIPNEKGDVDVEYMNFKFLPFVVNEETQHKDIAEIPYENDYCDLEVIYEEEAIAEASERFSMEHTETEVDADTCLLVDWSKVTDEQIAQEEPSEEVPHKELEIKESYGFSIFEELFRSCDTESKLLLMDEIIPIGDKKEVHFLRGLFKDKNAKVRKKAKEIEGLLVKRLVNELSERDLSESYVQWTSDSKNTTLLDIHFELDTNKEINKSQDKESE